MAGRFERLWYENEKGEHVPHDPNTLEAPPGAAYQISRFPSQLTTTWLHLRPDGGCEKIASTSATYSSDLVLALCRPGIRHRLNQLRLYRKLAPVYDFDMAVFLAAESCERCINSLAHRHGMPWGYREHSDEWHAAGTRCPRCSDSADVSTAEIEEIRSKKAAEIRAFFGRIFGEDSVKDLPPFQN